MNNSFEIIDEIFSERYDTFDPSGSAPTDLDADSMVTPGIEIKSLFFSLTSIAILELMASGAGLNLMIFLPVVASLLSVNPASALTLNQYELFAILIYTQIINFLLAHLSKTRGEFFATFLIMLNFSYVFPFFDPLTSFIFLVWCYVWKMAIFREFFGDEHNFALVRFWHSTMGGILFFALLNLL